MLLPLGDKMHKALKPGLLSQKKTWGGLITWGFPYTYGSVILLRLRIGHCFFGLVTSCPGRVLCVCFPFELVALALLVASGFLLFCLFVSLYWNITSSCCFLLGWGPSYLSHLEHIGWSRSPTWNIFWCGLEVRN